MITSSEDLKQDKVFRSMWADDYSTIDDMVEHFSNDTVLDDNQFRIEIRIAINTLDMEMRIAFLEQNYNNPKPNQKEQGNDVGIVEQNHPSKHKITYSK